MYLAVGIQSNKYFSKVSVLGRTPTLQLYNLHTKANEEYLTIKAEKDKMEGEIFQSINEQVKRIQDSTR